MSDGRTSDGARARLSSSRGLVVAGVVIALVMAPGCGRRIEGGLANAPSVQRHNMPRTTHDVIANGPESCPMLDAGDPFPQRVADCTEPQGDAGHSVGKRQLW
jgi:hypothetical protein